MNDNFEIFIKNAVLNSSTHQQKQQQSWIAIDNKLRKQKNNKRIWYFGIAASLLITISLGSVFLLQNNYSAKYYHSITNNEINETEYYYANLIELKYQQIANTNNLNKEYFQLFFDEMNKLDAEYNTYLQDAKSFGLQDDIVRAMVKNQQRRLQVLNRLLNEIKKVKNYENYENVKIST